MTKTKDLRDAVVQVLLNISPATGAISVVNPVNIFKTYDPKKLAMRRDQDYPKIFVVTDTGNRKRSGPQSKDDTTKFYVIFITKAGISDNAESVANAVDAFVDDCERAFDQHDTLFGRVTNAEMTTFTVDSGFCYPEGVAVCTIEVDQTGYSSEPASFTPSTPDIPTAVSPGIVDFTSYTVTWADGVAQQTGVEVWASLNGAGYALVATVPTGQQKFSTGTFTAGDTVCFKLRGINVTAYSDFTAEVCMTF